MSERIKITLTQEMFALLRDRLKEEALANHSRDLEIAEEWFPLEEEAWRINTNI